MVMGRIRSAAGRVRAKVRSLSTGESVLLSASQTLFALSILLFLLAIFGSYVGYGPFSIAIYVASGLLVLVVSYSLFRRLENISFPEFFVSLFLANLFGEERPVDAAGSLLFLGGLFIAATPLVYTLSGSVYNTASTLFLGALFAVTAVVIYVRRAGMA